MSEPIIRAGDITQYIYWARGWWRAQTEGLGPLNVERLSHGNELDAAQGRAMPSSVKLRRMSIIPVEPAPVCLVTALLQGGGP